MRSLILFLLIINSTVCFAKNGSLSTDSIPRKAKSISTIHEKLYCSEIAKTKYKLSINGSSITITRLYKQYTDRYRGFIKKGKIYSNNPDEKSLKDLQGKYYKLEGKNFGVLNIENGDYEWFTECKK